MAEFSVQKVTSFPTTGIVANRWYARLVSGAVEIRIANELGVLIPLNYVSVTGNETITGQKTFNNELLALFAENPVLRITALSNQSRIDFRTNAGLDAARILFNSSTNQLAISTNESNANIVISPHGTGKINLPNIPVGTGESLMRNAQGEIVRGSGLNATSANFTPVLVGQGLTFTYTSQIARIEKIGKVCTIFISINFSATGTPTGGGLKIDGLPINFRGISNRAQRVPVLQMQNSGYTNDQVSRLAMEIDGNIAQVEIVFVNQSIAQLTTYTSCSLIIQGSYISD